MSQTIVPRGTTQDASIEGEKPEERAGYLVMRLRPGEGLVISDDIEVRLASVSTRKMGEAHLAIRAPKSIRIRRVK